MRRHLCELNNFHCHIFCSFSTEEDQLQPRDEQFCQIFQKYHKKYDSITEVKQSSDSYPVSND